MISTEFHLDGPHSGPRHSQHIRSSVISWERDDEYLKNNNEDGLSSAELLLRWMTTSNNLDMYRGETMPDGKKRSKASVLNIIVDYFKKNGIDYRKEKNIRSRIDRMMALYKEASDWQVKYNEGTLEPEFYESLIGKTEAEKQLEVKAHMMRICKEYDRIDPFLKNATWPPPNASVRKKPSDTDDSDSEEEDYSSVMQQHKQQKQNQLITLDENGEPTTSNIPTTKRTTPLPEHVIVHSRTKKRKSTSAQYNEWRREMEAQQLAQSVADTQIKQVELELKQAQLNKERESMNADVLIKKNKAALEGLKFMHEEGLLSKEEYKEKCEKIVEQYSAVTDTEAE